MKGAASMDVTSALAAAPVRARAQHGGRPGSETGSADAVSFDAVLNDVQGAPDTASDKTAGSAPDAGTPLADKKAGRDSAVRAPDMASTDAAPSDNTAIGITAVNSAAALAGSTPPATVAQHVAPLAASGPGTPGVPDVPTSPVVATTLPTAAVAQTPAVPDPRLPLPRAALAGPGQPAAAHKTAAQGSGAQAAGAQQGAVQGGISLPAATAAAPTPADNGAAVPAAASPAAQSARAQAPAASPAAQSARAQAPAASGSGSPLGAAGSAVPATSATAVPDADGGLGAVGAPGNAPVRFVAPADSLTSSATSADSGSVAVSMASLPGVARTETDLVDNTAVDNTALDNRVPAVPATALAAAAGTATPAGQPPSASVPSAATQPAPSPPQAAQTLQPQLARPLFTLAGAPHGQHVMTLKVSPEDLGPLTVRAHIGAAGVRIELFAPGEEGREAVRGILPELRKELADAGFGASLDLSEHSGPSDAAQDGAGQGTAAQDGAGKDHGGNSAGQGNRNGTGDPPADSRWDLLADAAALRSARTLNGPHTSLDILV